MIHVEYAIIGHGITGSILAACLLRRGHNIIIFDDFNPSSPSKITSGLINPVTGRKFIKSWKSKELYILAQAKFNQISKLTGYNYFEPSEIHRVMLDKQHEDLWLERTAQEGYDEFLSKSLIEAPEHFIPRQPIGITLKAAKVDIPQFLNDSAHFLQKAGLLINHKLTREQIDLPNKRILSAYQFDQLIDCSGAGSFLLDALVKNDFVRPNVGERLLVRFDNYHCKAIIKANHFIIPWKEGLYWVGAHNDWQQTTSQPTEKGLDKLTDFIKRWIDSPYQVVDHKAGVRLTTKDRRPLVGTHPHHTNVHFINGLGTKGVSLAPYCVDQLMNYLFDGNSINPELGIERVS